ncbi:MAG: thiolase family protein [Acidimicrobiales bacterium]
MISGIGQSAIGRRLPQSAIALVVEACNKAITDAGLEASDIDGISTFPGMHTNPGFSPVGVYELQNAMRFELAWYNGAFETPGPCGSMVMASAAVEAGLATHVLCFRGHKEGSAQGSGGRASLVQSEVDGTVPAATAGRDWSWQMPFGVVSIANFAAMHAQRHFQMFGTSREQLAQIAITCRKNASLNPSALHRDPLSLEEYLSARMISDPLCLFDCDIPCDAATAVIVSSSDRTSELRRPPIQLESIGCANKGRFLWDQWEDMTTQGSVHSAEMLWSRTSLTPTDVDLALLYDGFSIFTLMWIESLGFCGIGEAGSFIEQGKAIGREGPLPINTHGGLSAGRVHGNGLFYEACLQLWGAAGERQLPSNPEVAVVAAGGGPTTACFLLTV